MGDMRTVHLPDDLCTAVEKKYQSHFNNLEELLVCILTNLSRQETTNADEDELELVEERLRDLGYL